MHEIIAITEYPTSRPARCEGVGVFCGITVETTGINVMSSVFSGVAVVVRTGVIMGVSFWIVVVTLVGRPRSISMSLLAAEREFSTLMENVFVDVAEEVWKATTARPSVSVVTRA